MLLSELPNFFTRARPEDVDLVAEIVKGFADSRVDTDDEALETIFTPLLSPERTFNGSVDLWRLQSISLLLDFVREATHEQTMSVTHLAGDIRGERQPTARKCPAVKDLTMTEQVEELKALLETAADFGALVRRKLDGIPIDANNGGHR